MKKSSFVLYIPFLVLLLLVSEIQSQFCFPQNNRPCEKGMQPNRQKRFVMVKVLERNMLCDTLSDGGGWLVMQRRLTSGGVTRFQQNWQKYKNGFGNICQDSWLGLDYVYRLTNTPGERYQLRIGMKVGTISYEAIYDDFKVDSEANRYKLSIGSFRGNISNDFASHNGAMFATPDNDNDLQCGCFYNVGWWFHKCFDVNLNGKTGNSTDESMGAVWESLTSQKGAIESAEMSFRKVVQDI
ncbi:Techylectin-5A [Bulinus truncatus]|nr:Techylectin-5A [Bulinus truncatus]